jgi:Tfp pilus assembly protein PilF
MNTYEKNMEALVKHHPELVARLQQGVDSRHITVQTAHSGALRLLVTTQEGEQVFIHNEDDPVASARITANNLSLEGNLVVLLGFGLGYLALELLTKLNREHFLLICETDLAIFEAALRCTDLEPLLLSEQVKMLVGEEIAVEAWLYANSAKYLNSKAFLIKYTPCIRVTPERYRSLEKRVLDTTKVLDVNSVTLMALGKLSMQNQFQNLPWVRRCPGVLRLANLFAGRPGIVVAAGPSLEKNFTLLKEAKGKAVIIATDTVLRLLLPHEILPDIVVTLDPQEMNYDKFRDVVLDPSVSLVYTPQSYPEIIKNCPGEKFVSAMGAAMYQHFAPFWGKKGNITVNAQSVAHMAYNLATLLGVDPIVFVGLDLCFHQQKTHAGNLATASGKVPSNNQVWTTDIFGERVQTRDIFKSFQVFLEEGLKSSKARCIDATEGGVRLEGTQVMRLRDVIDEYCQGEVMDITGMIRAAALVSETDNVGALLGELKQIKNRVSTMVKTSRKILHYVRVMQKMERNDQTSHPRYVRLSALAEQATNYMKEQKLLLDLLPSHAYQLQLYMSQQHIIDIDDIEDEDERLKQQLERAQVYYTGLVDVLEPFGQAIGACLKHFETEQALALLPRDNSNSLQVALQYKELGDYDRAIPLFEQRLQQQTTSPDALYHLADIYVQQRRYTEARPLLEKGMHLFKQFRGMQKLYAEYQQRMARWEEKSREARQQSTPLAKKRPTEALLEAGNFYFRVQDLERAKNEYRKVLQDSPDLSEAHYHLAHTYFAEEEFSAGVTELEEALRLAPDNSMLYRDLALVACKHGASLQAERFIRKAIELDPEEASLYEILADIYIEDGAWMQAAQTYEALLCIEPQRADILQNLAVVYQKQIAASLE